MTSVPLQINPIRSPSLCYLLGIRIERYSQKSSGSSRSSEKINIQTTSPQREDFQDGKLNCDASSSPSIPAEEAHKLNMQVGDASVLLLTSLMAWVLREKPR